MSRGGQVTAEAVRQMLVELADALRTAQHALSADASSGEGGGGRMGYEIPYLDFSFEVEFTSKEGEGGVAPILALRPRFGPSPTTDTTKEITSQVSGRLVSVPPMTGSRRPSWISVSKGRATAPSWPWSSRTWRARSCPGFRWPWSWIWR